MHSILMTVAASPRSSAANTLSTVGMYCCIYVRSDFLTSARVFGFEWKVRLATMGITDGVPWLRIDRNVFNEDSGTSTVDERRRRIKSAGRQASRTSVVEEVGGTRY